MNAQLTEAPVRESPVDGAGPSIRIAAAQERGPSDDASDRQTVIELQDVSCYYGSFRAVRNVDHQGREAADHGAHRSIGLRQVHAACARSTG